MHDVVNEIVRSIYYWGYFFPILTKQLKKLGWKRIATLEKIVEVGKTIDLIGEDNNKLKNWLFLVFSFDLEYQFHRIISILESVRKENMPEKVVLLYLPLEEVSKKSEVNFENKFLSKVDQAGFSFWVYRFDNETFEYYIDKMYPYGLEFHKSVGNLINSKLRDKIRSRIVNNKQIPETLVREAIVSAFTIGVQYGEKKEKMKRLKDSLLGDLLIGGIFAGVIFLLIECLRDLLHNLFGWQLSIIFSLIVGSLLLLIGFLVLNFIINSSEPPRIIKKMAELKDKDKMI